MFSKNVFVYIQNQNECAEGNVFVYLLKFVKYIILNNSCKEYWGQIIIKLEPYKRKQKIFLFMYPFSCKIM